MLGLTWDFVDISEEAISENRAYVFINKQVELSLIHIYLQLCEDLGMEPLYVCNCGMTCQGRKSVLLEGEALDEMVQEMCIRDRQVPTAVMIPF